MPTPLKQFNFKITDLDEQKVLELKQKARKFGQGRALTGGGKLTSVKIDEIKIKYGDFAQDYIGGYNSSFDDATYLSKKEHFNKLANMRRIKRKCKLQQLAVIEAATDLLPVSILEPSNITLFPDFIMLQNEQSQYPSESSDKHEIASTYDKRNPRIYDRMQKEEKITILQKRIDECMKELKNNTDIKNNTKHVRKINKTLKLLSNLGFDITNLAKDCEMVITESKINNYKNKIKNQNLTRSARAQLSTYIWKNEVFLLQLRNRANVNTILEMENKDKLQPAVIVAQNSTGSVDNLLVQLKCDEELDFSEIFTDPNKPLLKQYNLTKASAVASPEVESPVSKYLNLSAFTRGGRSPK